jgi:hypothetical protein
MHVQRVRQDEIEAATCYLQMKVTATCRLHRYLRGHFQTIRHLSKASKASEAMQLLLVGLHGRESGSSLQKINHIRVISRYEFFEQETSPANRQSSQTCEASSHQRNSIVGIHSHFFDGSQVDK